MTDYNELNRRETSMLVISALGIRTARRVTEYTKDIQCNCPFHEDRKPSMGINLDTGVYHCFSCNRSGTVEGLYKELTGNSFYKTFNIKTDSFSGFAKQRDLYADYDKMALEKKTVYLNYDRSLLTPVRGNRLCMAYLKKRGIPLSLAEEYGFKYAKDMKINATTFKDRLCIPVYEDGVLTSIEGRALNYDKNDINSRKVLYPLNTSVNLLYNIDNLNFDEDLFACEGLMDLFVLKTCSYFENSTSIFGATLTKRKLSQIARCNKRFIYIPDLDEAGWGTVKTLKESGLDNVYVLILPHEVNGMSIKDIGDLPKANSNPQELVDRKWLNRIRNVKNVSKNDIVF